MKNTIKFTVLTFLFFSIFGYNGMEAQCDIVSNSTPMEPIAGERFYTMNVVSNHIAICEEDLIFSNLPDWVTSIRDLGGTKAKEIAIYLEANNSGSDRVGTISLKLGNQSATWTIIQRPYATNTGIGSEQLNTITSESYDEVILTFFWRKVKGCRN